MMNWPEGTASTDALLVMALAIRCFNGDGAPDEIHEIKYLHTASTEATCQPHSPSGNNRISASNCTVFASLESTPEPIR